MPDGGNRYEKLIEDIFLTRFKPGMTEVPFEREDIERTAKKLKITLPKNLGDLIYSFRYRAKLPDAISSTAKLGKAWTIRPSGKSLYKFVLGVHQEISADPKLPTIDIADSTPGMVAAFALGDEQAVLARIRYNRLIDTFTGTVCHSLQNHLRTTVPGMGQVETDEVYVGVNADGEHFVFPVQAKGPKDHIGVVQIDQDVALCAKKFPMLKCVPVAAQLLADGTLALFSFVVGKDGQPEVHDEKHYRLVPSSTLFGAGK